MSLPARQSPRGLLVVVEGLDRSGKSSQCQKLCEQLQEMGVKVRYAKFPGSSFSPAVQQA